MPILDQSASPCGPTLIAALLREQQSLSAAERFSEWHSQGDGHREQSQGESGRVSARYRSLLPATPPGPNQQYGFDVDLDRCSGCKACVVACHTLNGLDDSETWRDVGLLMGGSRMAPVIQHVTASCHHCLQPACMIACPVNAYDKDPITGIVKHLDDQCFGCQYCTMACPYEVPKYHPGKGIVRKCDMCSSRLAVGQAPACVQACPHEAITIRLVEKSQVIDDAEASQFLPAAPDPQLTLPTTTYNTKRSFPRNLLPADYFRVNPQHAHWPLVIMLVLTQLSVGAFTVGLILERLLNSSQLTILRPLHSVMALGFAVLALSASLLHLGRPQFAFRAVLGLRHSWLSREIVAFGAFAALAAIYAVVSFRATSNAMSDISRDGDPAWVTWLGWSVVATGTVAVFCSIMIYVFTRRECWSFFRVASRFLLTCLLLGVAAVWLSVLMLTMYSSRETASLIRAWGPALCWAIVALTTTKLAWELSAFRYLIYSQMTSMKRSALLMAGDLSNATLARFALGALGGIVLPAMLAIDVASLDASLTQFAIMTGLLFAACLAGELLERYLFFTACAAPRMPGGIR